MVFLTIQWKLLQSTGSGDQEFLNLVQDSFLLSTYARTNQGQEHV